MSIDQLIASGMLELYVIGDLSQSEESLVENFIEHSEKVRAELFKIEEALETFAFNNVIPPEANTKPLLFATKNFMDRLHNGEVPSCPPSLGPDSKISDFAPWLDREDMQEPEEYDSMFGRIIYTDEKKTTLIVWLRDGSSDEIHVDEHEKFLIVEGTCDITIGNEVHSLKAGDNLEIPLFVNHNVKVTSTIRCKVILERAAA